MLQSMLFVFARDEDKHPSSKAKRLHASGGSSLIAADSIHLMSRREV